jgi:nicotinamidase-related amidase
MLLKKVNTGLIVVDIQGKLAQIVHDSDQVIARTTTLIRGAQALNLPILWLEQNPDKLGATVPAIRDVLAPHEPITKYTFDACGEKNFIKALQKSKVNQWLVCGIEAHICVYQTVASMVNLGHSVELVCDCISSRTEFHKELAIAKLSAKGVGLTSVEMCLYELVADCRTPEFKEILRLVK